MEEQDHFTFVVSEDCYTKPPSGLQVLRLDNFYSIWIWLENEIVILEGASIDENNESNSMENLKKSEFKLNTKVIDLFYTSGYSTVHVLEETGIIHSFTHTKSMEDSAIDFMDIDDIMSSPSTNSDTAWKKDQTMRIGEDYKIICACQFTEGIVVLASKDNQLITSVHSQPDFSLKFILHLKDFKPQDAVISSCSIQTLTSDLKDLFKNNLEPFDKDIVVIGLQSGLVIWFCSNTPVKGPFILSNTYQKIQSIHWMTGVNGEFTLLLILLCSGQMIVYGKKRKETLHLPDSVNSSLCLSDYFITSNRIDCYVSKLQFNGEIVLNSANFPVKGVLALSNIPGTYNILAATLHGVLYSFNPTLEPSGNPCEFAMPDQSLLDNLYTLSKSLDHIYFESNKEDGITKAIIAGVIGKKISPLFGLSIEVITDEAFSVTVKSTDHCLTFSNEFWLACVEILDNQNITTNLITKLKQDFNGSSQFSLKVNHNLLIGSVVSVYLIATFSNQLPSLEVQLGKVKIDACHLLSNHVPHQNVPTKEDSLSNILRSVGEKPFKCNLQEFKLILKIPSGPFPNSPLATILQDSQHKFSMDDWKNISNGKKLNIQTSINGIPNLISMEPEKKELRITCCDIQLCHQIKEAIIKRWFHEANKFIFEDEALDIQALHQSFEILKLKDEPDFNAMESIRNKLRENMTQH